uniref:Uncharacterized protein n=1 Tax=Vitis vinifera TaxID=29760 RepID=F6HP78_VITVI
MENQRIEEKAPPMIIATTKGNSSGRKLDTIYEDKDPHGRSQNQTAGVSCANSEG